MHKHTGFDASRSLGKPGLTDELFQQAGFARGATTKLEAPFRLPSVIDFIRNSASPILQILTLLDLPAKEAAWAHIIPS